MGAVPQMVNINQYYFMGGMPGMPMMAQQPSGMDQFMYGINSQVAMATAGPYGGSVVDWAQSLAAGQQQGQQQPGAGGGSGGGASGMIAQIVSMLMQIIVAKVQANKAGR